LLNDRMISLTLSFTLQLRRRGRLVSIVPPMIQGQFENAREICTRPAIDSGSPSPIRPQSLRSESVGRNGDAEMTFIATSTLTLAEERYRVAVVIAFSLNSPCNKTHPRDVKTTRGCANITATANTSSSPSPLLPLPPAPPTPTPPRLPEITV